MSFEISSGNIKQQAPGAMNFYPGGVQSAGAFVQGAAKPISAQVAYQCTYQPESAGVGFANLPEASVGYARSVVSSISDNLKIYSQATTAAAGRRAADVDSGVAFWDGVKGVLNTSWQDLIVQYALDTAGGASPSASSSNRAAAGLEQLGQAGQAYLWDQFRTEATEYIGKQLGATAAEVASSGATSASVAGGAVAGEAGVAAAAGKVVAGGAKIGGAALGAAGALYSAYGLIDGYGKSTPQMGAMQGATVGAYVGSAICPGMGTAVGGVIGAVAGALLGMVKNGKHKDQVARDGVRDTLVQAGIVDSNYMFRLADGTGFDIGKDGGFKLQNADGTYRAAYDVDFKNPLAAQVVGLVNPLVVLITGGDPKLTSDFTGYFVNAALSNATTLDQAKKNVRELFEKLKISREQAAQGLQALTKTGRVTQDELAAYMNGINTLLGIETKRKKSTTSKTDT